MNILLIALAVVGIILNVRFVVKDIESYIQRKRGKEKINGSEYIETYSRIIISLLLLYVFIEQNLGAQSPSSTK